MKNSDILDMEIMSIEHRAKLIAFATENNMDFYIGLDLEDAREVVSELEEDEYSSSYNSSGCEGY